MDGRKFQRIPVKLHVDYSDVDNFLSSFATNISEGGIFINTKETYPVGSDVLLKFILPKTRKTIRTSGRVVWCNPYDKRGDEYIGMGIEFQNLSKRDKALIKEVIEKLKI